MKNKKMSPAFRPFTEQGADALYRQISKDDRPIHWPTVSELIFLQYTGLKDIDGKEICEGDVVGHYVAEEIGGPRTFESFRSEIKWWPDMVDVSRARIIGNIYENPELLKGDEA